MPKKNKPQDNTLIAILQLLNSLSSKTILILAAILVVAAVAFLVWIVRGTSATLTNQSHVELSPTQVESLRAIGQWEFLTITDEEIADTTRRGFFSNDELVRIYSGTLRLGIDMADIGDGWIEADKDTIRVVLPPVKLLDENFIDEAATRSFYETGTWNQEARQALADKARQKMKARCLTPQNIASAEQNAAAQFHQLLRSMGFQNVIIRFQKPANG